MRIFHFPPFTLDQSRYELKRGDEIIVLPRIPMEILQLLLVRGDALLSRAEIASCIWPESDPEDVVPSINTAINRIRKALSDDPLQPAYIQTVIGKGYRFIAAVERLELSQRAPESFRTTPATDEFQAQASTARAQQHGEQSAAEVPQTAFPRPGRRRTSHVVGLCFMLAALFFGVVQGFRFLSAKRAPRGPALSLSDTAPKLQVRDAVTAILSPDAKQIAYIAGPSVRIHNLADGTEVTLHTPAFTEISHLAWFPDGSHLLVSGIRASSAAPEVWMISTATADPLLMRADARLGTPSPTGKEFAFTRGDGSELWVMDRMGLEPRQVFAGESGDVFPVLVWTDDGRTLLVNRLQHKAGTSGPAFGPYKGMSSSFLAVDEESGTVSFQQERFEMEAACLLRADRLLFFRGGEGSSRLGVVRINPATGAFQDTPVMGSESPSVRSLSASSSGRVLASVYRVRDQVGAATLGENHLFAQVSWLAQPEGDSYPHDWTP